MALSADIAAPPLFGGRMPADLFLNHVMVNCDIAHPSSQPV